MKRFIWLSAFAFTTAISAPRFGNQNSSITFGNANSYFVLDTPISGFNGTLELPDESIGRITGQNIVFSNGAVKVAGNTLAITGTYSPQQQKELSLATNNTVVLPSGSVDKQITINANSTASIAGAPNLTQPIVLQSSTSVLNVGLQSQVSQNIELNGGKLVLDDNLSLQAGKQFVGNGTIDVNGRTLKLPKGTAATGKLTFLAANDISLSGNLIDSTEYAFTGTGQTSEISGGGYSWTFNSGGLISVGPNHTLYCANINFQEFGHQPSYGYFSIDATSTIVFQGCTLNMTGSYTHAQGTMEFADGCKIVHRGNTFGVTGTACIRVNGATLLYDSLGDIDKNPFSFTDINSQRILLNNGAIKSSNAVPSLALTSTTLSFNTDYRLAADSIMQFQNSTPLVTKNITADFNGHSITFPKTNTSVLFLDPKVNLTLNNAVLLDFNQNAISYADANASINFGSGTQIRLVDSQTIGVSNKSWNFTGNSLVCGTSTGLVLDGSARITVAAGATLTLQDLQISIKNLDSITMASSTAKIVLQNCDLILGANGFGISQGNVEIKGKVRVFGGDSTNFSTDSVLSFSSPGTFTVLSDSLLKLGKHVIFEYKANPSGDGGITKNSKRHFILASATATLELDGCTLHSTLTGLALDYGRLVVSDRSFLQIDGSSGREAEIGSALEVFIRPSTSLVVTGTLAYNQTSLP